MKQTGHYTFHSTALWYGFCHMTRLLIATRNRHKVEEIRAILGEHFEFLTLEDFPKAPEIVEDAGSFAGNATKKSTRLAKWLDAQLNPEPESRGRVPDFVLADDSGLEVDALNGAPGVHSARFAALDTGTADNSPPVENNLKLLRLLKDVPPGHRTARFRCMLALTPVAEIGPEGASPICYADEFELRTELFEGTCEGQIDFAPRGNAGFGYDPLFVPEGYEQTFGELSALAKNQLSHRGKALARLKQYLISVGDAHPVKAVRGGSGIHNSDAGAGSVGLHKGMP